MKTTIEIIWDIEDIDVLIEDQNIKFKRPLTDEEKMMVLKKAKLCHDASIGINWEVLEDHLRNLFSDIIIE